MLDVHPPHSRIEGLRDFLLHLLTITVGLLIALGLEAAVEAAHHRHQREEAETKIREEIRGNEASLQRASTGLMEERKAMVTFLAELREVAAGRDRHQHVQLDFHEEEIPDAAWRTASSTGVLEYMPYDEVERFADAYREQALLQQMAQKTLEDYLELTPAMGGDAVGEGSGSREITSQEAVQMLPTAERTLGHLNGILATGQGTLQSYAAALK